MKKLLLIIAAELLFFSGFSQTNVIAHAKDLMQRGEYVKAKNLLNSYVLSKPQSEAYMFLGDCYYVLNKPDSAIWAYKKALIRKMSPESLFKLGLTYFTEQGDISQAKAYFKRAYALAPDSSKYLLYLGLAYQAENDIDSAYYFYKQVMSRDTTNPYPYYFLADYMYGLDSLNYAYAFINRAISKDSKNYNFYLLKASIEFKAKLYQNALESAQQGLKLNPNSFKLNFLAAQCLYQLQKYDQAERILLELLKQQPRNLNLYFYLGWIYYYTAQYQKSIQMAKAALNISKTTVEFYQILAYDYIATSKYIEAQKAADKILMYDPQSLIAYTLKVEAQLYARTPKNVLGSDKKFVKLNALNVGYIKDLIHNPKSKYYFPKLFKKFENSPWNLSLDEYLMVYLGYGLNHKQIQKTDYTAYARYYRMKQYNECINQALAALKSYPLDPMPYLYIALSYKNLGDLQKFIKNLTVYHGILKSIVSSGNGMSFISAYLISNKNDIYDVANYSLKNLANSVGFGIKSVLHNSEQYFILDIQYPNKIENKLYFLQVQ